jgi:WD40 repeat protein
MRAVWSKDAVTTRWPSGLNAALNTLNALSSRPVNAFGAAFSPDSRRIVTASDDKAARIWDPRPAR